MKIESLLAWWNLIYTVPFLLAVAYLAIYATSGLTFGDADADADADAHIEPDAHMDVHADVDGDVHADVHLDPHADMDADADADVDAVAHLDTDAHVDADADADADHDVVAHHDAHVTHAHSHAPQAARGMGAMRFFGWIGLGRVPLSLILMVLMLTWGMVGFVVNRVLTSVVPMDWMVLFGSLPLAAISSLAVTRTMVRLMARWMPTTETYARPLSKLVGATGRALYPIDQRFGMASVRDQHGDFFQIACRVYPDRQPITKGEDVLLVDFDVQGNFFYVAEYDLERPSAKRRLS
jgi:hypothetical protein